MFVFNIAWRQGRMRVQTIAGSPIDERSVEISGSVISYII